MDKSIIDALRKPLVGQGMVKEAAVKMQQTPGYRQYVIDKQSGGEQPVTLEQFLKGMR